MSREIFNVDRKHIQIYYNIISLKQILRLTERRLYHDSSYLTTIRLALHNGHIDKCGCVSHLRPKA